MDARGRRQVPTPYPPPTKTYFIYYDCDHRLCTDVCPLLTSPPALLASCFALRLYPRANPSSSSQHGHRAVQLSSLLSLSLSLFASLRACVFHSSTLSPTAPRVSQRTHYPRLEDTPAGLRRRGADRRSPLRPRCPGWLKVRREFSRLSIVRDFDSASSPVTVRSRSQISSDPAILPVRITVSCFSSSQVSGDEILRV